MNSSTENNFDVKNNKIYGSYSVQLFILYRQQYLISSLFIEKIRSKYLFLGPGAQKKNLFVIESHATGTF